jgi:hypothetical protein
VKDTADVGAIAEKKSQIFSLLLHQHLLYPSQAQLLRNRYPKHMQGPERRKKKPKVPFKFVEMDKNYN